MTNIRLVTGLNLALMTVNITFTIVSWQIPSQKLSNYRLFQNLSYVMTLLVTGHQNGEIICKVHFTRSWSQIIHSTFSLNLRAHIYPLYSFQGTYHVVDTGSFGWQQFGSLPALILAEQSNSATPNCN